MKILLHVNYFEGPGKLDTLFKLAKINGYDGVELRQKYNFQDMSQGEYLAKVAQLKSNNPEMEIVFSCSVNFARGAANQIEEDVDAFFEFMEWARRNCGTKVINFFLDLLQAPGAEYASFHLNGSAIATEEDFAKSAAGLRRAGDQAVKNGMLVALETHNCYIHDLVLPCRKLMDMAAHEAIGINYDHGNIFINQNGSSISEVFNVLGDKIYYAHLKNLFTFKSIYMMSQLEHGHIDCAEIMAGLKQCLKSGMLATEYPCSGDGIIAAKRDMEYVKFIREWLNL
jgi:sugar phosphate isomerase/epimerase